MFLLALLPSVLALNQVAAHLEQPAAKRVNDHHHVIRQAPTPTLSTLFGGTTVVTLAPATLIPSLSAIFSGGSVEAGLPLPTTYQAGAVPPLKGAVGLPSISVPMPTGAYPAPDFIPPVDSPEVLAWMQELEGHDIPSFDKTIASDNNCVTNAAAAADKSRCWWTCGGCAAPDDITVCPDKMTWGLSYDDGPSTYTPKLLDFLSSKSLKATFFVVGSRVFYNPDVLRSEYMQGHQISVHTWSHPALTNLTNAEIVAELGWSRKIIKDVLGVTPRTYRPPFGDVDNRVRAIASAMGLQTIIWTGVGNDQYDTDDWKVPAGTVNGQQSYDAFNNIISKATSNLTTGFIVLEHDLYQQTVDMSVGYFVPTAINESFTLKPINECLHVPLTDVYVETNTNSTAGSGSGGVSSGSTGSSSTATITGAASKSSASKNAASKSEPTTSTSGTTNGALNVHGGVGLSAVVAGVFGLSLLFV